MKFKCLILAALASLGWRCAYGASDVVIENTRCRLVLSGDGYAKSLVVKATGEEMVEPGARVPFSTITQNRAYDNEFKLMYAAKPWTLPSVRIERVGDELRIRYRDEFFVAVVKLEVTSRCIGFRLLRFDYDMEATGYKRKTEIDSFALAQLPMKRRGHFGRTLNVVWDEGTAFAALMAANPETRIDALDRESGGVLMFAGGEKSVGLGSTCAVLAVAGEREDFLDCVDAFERDYGLPHGVKSRRGPLAAASYLSDVGITPDNVGDYIGIARAAGIRAVQLIGLGGLWRTNGHFPPKDAFRNGLDDCRKVADALKEAGILPGLHFFCTKVTRDDEYLAGGKPDPRMNMVCEVVLARDASETDTELQVQSAPVLLRREKDRGLVQFGDELVMYGGFTEEPPYMLTNCVRGLWGSKAAAHPRNAIGRHLDVDDWVKFIRCGTSGIVDEIADRIAGWMNAGGLRFCYMDGAEDVPEPFWCNVPRVQWNLWKRLKEEPAWSETALKSHFGWHMHTRGNAFDIFENELQRKAMRKYILRTARQDADDFSPVNLGWLSMQPPKKPNPSKMKTSNAQYALSEFGNCTMGLQPDTVEYVACKAAAWRSPVGFKVSPGRCRSHPRARECLAAFKRWEDAKLGNRFTGEQLEAFKAENREWFLWPFAPQDRPEPVEWRQITEDSKWLECPIRAFSYSRGGVSGIAYWRIDAAETPEIVLPGVDTSSMRDDGIRFVESAIPEKDIVSAFLRELRKGPTAEVLPKKLPASREKILEFFEQNIYGEIPPAPKTLKFECIERGRAFNGVAERRQYVVHSEDECGMHEFRVLLYLPEGICGKVPVFCYPNFSGNHTLSEDAAVIEEKGNVYSGKRFARGGRADRMPVEYVLRRGFAVATWCYASLYPDFGHDDELETSAADSVYAIFPPNRRGQRLAHPAWAWGAMRVRDLLSTLEEIDQGKVGMVGQSRMGKNSVITGAFDTRFTFIGANCGGVKPLGILPNLLRPLWFSERMKAWARNRLSGVPLDQVKAEASANALPPPPFDQSELIGCIAPRAFYAMCATEDLSSYPESVLETVRAAQPYFLEYGGNIGWHQKKGRHSIEADDWRRYCDFAAYHLGWISQKPSL